MSITATVAPVPRQDDERAFRDVLGSFPTGVAVVATRHGGRHALVVNSFTSVSLVPPLVLFCVGHRSTTWPAIRAEGRFAVSILAADQEEVARVCAGPGDRFGDPGVADRWAESAGGLPVVRGATGWLECRIDAVHPAGDHDVVIGAVEWLQGPSEGRPLVFVHGGFASVGTA